MSLEELQLELPKIELNETRFLLGGTGYGIDGQNSIPHVEPIIATHEIVSPIDLDPNGPEDVGNDDIPADDIDTDLNGGGDQTDQQDDGVGDYEDNSDPNSDYDQGQTDDNYQDEHSDDVHNDSDPEAQDNVDQQQDINYPEKIDINASDEEIIDKILNLIGYVAQNEASGLDMSHVFSDSLREKQGGVGHNTFDGSGYIEGVFVRWDVQAVFADGVLTSELSPGNNDLDRAYIEELSDGRVLVKIDDNEVRNYKPETRVMLTFQSMEDWEKVKHLIWD